MSAPLRHVSDTALWVAMCRALESERADAAFKDPFARLLAGERGAAILDDLPQGRALAWPIVARTVLIDQLILACCHADPDLGTVLNLGAGLDARAFRLALPAALRWVDVDLPELIAVRDQALAHARAACIHDSVSADLSQA